MRREAYTYDETPGDFELKHFSIEHDEETLVPFIQAAKKTAGAEAVGFAVDARRAG